MASMNLSPSQRRAVEALRHDWSDTNSFVLWAPYGLGRSTMLRAVQAERGGIVLDMASYLDRLTEAEPLALEETLHQMLMSALRENDALYRTTLQNILAVETGLLGEFGRGARLPERSISANDAARLAA